MANMRQVAELAGCSPATVSRVLSGDSRFKVTDETRKKIFDAVRSLDYSLPARESSRAQIGCVLSITAEKYSDPFFTDILGAIERECETQNLAISSTKTYNELRSPNIFQEFISAGLTGVILMERIPDDMLEQISAHIPNIIFIDNDEDDYHYNGVGFDHRLANKQAIGCLLAHGYRRIALISGSSPNEPMSDSIRLSTYRDALRKAGIDYDESLIKDCWWDLDTCSEQTRELMDLKEPPDAIFAGSDSLASAVLSTLYSMGKKCPEDVGIIGFNNNDMCSYMVPPLTTVDVPTESIGEVAVQRMSEMIREGKSHEGATSVRKILLPTRVIERGSLRKESVTPE
ncbi:MAG: LacI family DNA-binding transcriptional regulator [Firmicutes bacterium]|nr:LacI family DNA-binding transcriptional regulator [Bacillota bacterium]MBQ2678494.1 LacI family DNA-binding transcriptional regulator [Bacillota bacterium]